MFLAELPRFDNSQNLEMMLSGKFGRGVASRTSGMLPGELSRFDNSQNIKMRVSRSFPIHWTPCLVDTSTFREFPKRQNDELPEPLIAFSWPWLGPLGSV
jgi:hypothetical protein